LIFAISNTRHNSSCRFSRPRQSRRFGQASSAGLFEAERRYCRASFSATSRFRDATPPQLDSHYAAEQLENSFATATPSVAVEVLGE